MDNAARTRQRVLAVFLPVTAVFYIGAEALSPKGTDQVISTTATALKVLTIAARHPDQLYAYFVSECVAPVLMGYALWRSRSVPRWLAVLFVIGLYAAEFQSSGGAIVVVYMLPFAAAMVLLAARLWQAAALPASQPQLESAGVPV